MNKYALTVSGVALMAAMGVQPASAAPWSRGYVVGFYEMAFRYGGRPDYAKGTEIEPGIDCPHGSTTAFANPETSQSEYSVVPWLTKREIDILSVRLPLDQRKGAPQGPPAAKAYRGYQKDIQTYINPFAAEDPGELEVTSHIAEGFNLDGKVKPTDFTSPDGEAGIDNNLYKAWGCDAPWRGDGNGVLVLRSNDKMDEGLYTVVIRVSGNKDPMNDDNAQLEIGYSPDKIMKDARGAVGQDYSYRLIKGPQYTKLKAKIKDGVVESEQADVHMPQIAWFPDQKRDSNFRQGKIKLVMNPDGSATGLVGGYRDWRDLYAQNTYAQDGAQQGGREHEDHVALYFALRRNADGLFNPKTGRYDGISSAYRMKLAQAYVVDPPVAMGMPTVPAGDLQPLYSYDMANASFRKATDTLIPQPVPEGSTEQTKDGQKVRGFGSALRGANDPMKKYWSNLLNKTFGAGKTMDTYLSLWSTVPLKPYVADRAAAGKTAARKPLAQTASADEE